MMATVFIQKRKGKNYTSYVIQYYDPITGKKTYHRSFRKQREAQTEANDLRSLLDSGKKPVNKRTVFRPLTFGTVSESLKTEWQNRLDRKDLSQKTVTDYIIWLNILNTIFGDKTLYRITVQEITDYRDGVAVRTSNVNANKHLSTIKKVFVKGMELKAVIEDVTEEIPFLNEKDHVRNQFIMPGTLDALIEATGETRAKFYLPAIIFLGAEHGAAKQEILSLTWKKINFDFRDTGLITLFRTKNSRERTEFLMPRTREALLAWKKHLEWMRHRKKVKDVKTDHVFCRLDGTPIKNFNKAWWHVLNIVGLKNFHFHDLRHTFCSNLLLSGGTIKDAKDMIGHADISMTDRYSHITSSHQHSVQKQLAEHYAPHSQKT
jgi:integrase